MMRQCILFGILRRSTNYTCLRYFFTPGQRRYQCSAWPANPIHRRDLACFRRTRRPILGARRIAESRRVLYIILWNLGLVLGNVIQAWRRIAKSIGTNHANIQLVHADWEARIVSKHICWLIFFGTQEIYHWRWVRLCEHHDSFICLPGSSHLWANIDHQGQSHGTTPTRSGRQRVLWVACTTAGSEPLCKSTVCNSESSWVVNEGERMTDEVAVPAGRLL
jgi:hypothetical protein